jgi:hypothetical protein
MRRTTDQIQYLERGFSSRMTTKKASKSFTLSSGAINLAAKRHMDEEEKILGSAGFVGNKGEALGGGAGMKQDNRPTRDAR